MKFRDGELIEFLEVKLGYLLWSGMWLVAEGKRVEYAEEVYSINESQDGKKITLLCPTMQIRSRGDTLNRPTLTVVCQHSMIPKSKTNDI
jgi:hypothetical protein